MSIKIFQVVDQTKTLQDIVKILKRQKPDVKKTLNSQGEEVDLHTTIDLVKEKQNSTYGTGVFASIKYDYLDNYTDRDGKQQSIIKSKIVDFAFISGSVWLLIFTRESESDKIATKISRIIYNQQEDPVLICQIFPHEMNGFLNKHPHSLKRCNWDGVNLPNLNKVNFLGTDMGDSADYNRFDSHGQKNSLMVFLHRFGITISLNRQASIHFYSKQTKDEQINFIVTHILPMCR